ncbi:MAG: acyl-CoA desaturase [Cytophagaceae bacterium]
MSNNTRLKFAPVDSTGFFTALKKNVDQYFQERNISKKANAAMIFKTIFFFGGVWVLYGLILSQAFSLTAMLLMAMALGFFMAGSAFNISHDSMHGAYSSKDWVNNLLSYSFNILGANKSVWLISHNIVHHTYTNIEDHDEDLEVAPGLVRLTQGDKVSSIQKYQHYYAFLLYGFASLSWVFRKDYVKIFQDKIGQHETKHYTTRDYVELFAFKALHYAIFIIIPFIVLDITWWQFLLGFLALHFTMGLTLGLVFQLAHVIEETHFPEPNDQGNIDDAWAVHQMKTTANFARNSFLATFICGGLNYQVEHHLFPKVCHIHYPAISHIVKATAEQYGVPYIESETFVGALHSHYKVLKKFSLEAA